MILNWSDSYRNAFLYALWFALWLGLFFIGLRDAGLPWHKALADASISLSVIGILHFAIRITLKYYRPGSASLATRFGYVAALAALGAWGTQWLLLLVYSTAEIHQFLWPFMWLRFAVLLLMLLLVAVHFWLNQSIREIHEERKRNEESAALLKQAELENLRQKIQPHFLFNSLNSINALVTIDAQRSRRMVQQLSDYFRHTLQHDDKKLTSLNEEMAQVKRYMEIEQVRFGDRLRTSIELQPEAGLVLVPALILQPLVENAIKHGLYGTVDEVLITMEATLENGWLHIAIHNPTDPTTTAVPAGTGFGIASVLRRLQLVYGSSGKLHTALLTNERKFTARLQLPALTSTY